MADIQTFGVLKAAVSVVIGPVNSMLHNRMAQETRERELKTKKAQLFMQINTQWKYREFIKGFYDMLNLWG